ncbi:cyclin-domain-containing protein [Sodiomyces alkalinus F11]|uniref:Cyclin-domain-containing protein n=1 Tax=Sodiomyces alkalinus (strain CBS 110278 / VKM F-3762 / F11) TaxID=1314773 RepID=A0A3N2Q0T2_SODAK|nr:cyclin-domain-containing protein [Sodiomyces alkalinus F11]ROT40298.1 cyclin-domain-containing protein [Sodiomyces alkalinus F11]
MLTSPRIASSTNASPTTFHYAPTHVPSSPQPSPSRVSASLIRRRSISPSSSLSKTSPSLQHSPTTPSRQQPQTTPPPKQAQPAQPKRYVAVDAGTQYSPMEPTTTISSTVAGPRADEVTIAASASASGAPATSHSQPTNPTIPESRPTILEPSPSASTIRQQGAGNTTPSPGKRRASQGHDPAPPPNLSAYAGSEGSSSAKRQRPAPRPHKNLPLKYEFCEREDMVILIAHMLSELIETNDALALRSGNLTRFHSRTAPSISVLEYLNRLAKHATLTPPLLLSMVYYIDRMCALYPEFTINTLTVHRFLITAATVAAKGLSDSFWNNSTYARVGGVRVAELKLLELEFLYRVEWKIVPNPDVLVAYYRGLVERCPGYVLESENETETETETETERPLVAGEEVETEGSSTDISDDMEEMGE